MKSFSDVDASEGMKSPSQAKKADDVRSSRGSKLLPLHLKALLHCREHLLKSLNPEIFCSNKTADGHEEERKCERLSQYLEHLEQGDDRSFSRFMELLKQHNMEAYNRLEQTMKSLEDDEDDESLQDEEIYCGEKASMTGLAIRDLLKRHKFRISDQSIREFNTFDPETTRSRSSGYVECFVVASRGQDHQKSWIKHDKRRKVKDASSDDVINSKAPFMATLIKDLVFKLIKVADIPDLVTKPANCVNAYTVDEASMYSPATSSTQMLNTSNHQLSSSLKSSFKSDKMSNIHEVNRKLQNVHIPPPLPPKPDSLSPLLNIRLRERFQQHNSPARRTDDRASDTSLSGRSTCTLPPPIPAREKIENCVKPPPVAPPANSMFSDNELMTMPQLSSYPKAYDSDHYHQDTDDGIDDDNISLSYFIEPEDGEEQYERIGQSSSSSKPTEKKIAAKRAVNLPPPLPLSSLPPSSESLEKVYDIEKEPQTHTAPTNSEETRSVTSTTAVDKVQPETHPTSKTSCDASDEATGLQDDAGVSVSRSSSGVSTTIKTRDSGFDSVVSHSLHESPLCAAEQTEDLDTIIPEPVDNQATDSSGKLLNCAEPSYYEDIDLMNNEQTSHYLDPRPDEPDNDHSYSPSSSEQKVVTAGTLLMCECSPACKGESTSTYNEYIDERKRKTLAAFKDTRICYDREGAAYYIGAEELKRFGDPRGEAWFYPIPLSIKEATLFLRQEKQKGCFIVYQTIDVGDHVPEGCAYFLSLSGVGSEVVHYPIVENYGGDFMVEGHDHSFLNVCDLVQYFRRNKSCLLTRLRRPLKESRLPIIPGYHYASNFELLRKSVKLHGKIFSEGKFGLTCLGNYGRQQVFVKALQNDSITDEEDDFLNEALVLMNIEHENVIKLVGVCFKSRPFFILTEHFGIGTLKDSLSNGFFSSDKCEPYFDMCVQMVSAMVHLEKQRFVLHRNLSANNFLISSNYVIKLFNFERARRVDDDCYSASSDEDVPVRWSPPEVLRDSFYSTKSDVWSLAVVFWELFSQGQLPYGGMSEHEVVVHVSERGRLGKPQSCDGAMFSIMVQCWKFRPSARPSFAVLESRLKGQCGLYFTNPQRKFSDVASPLHSSASLSEDLQASVSHTLKKISSKSGTNTPLVSTPTLNFRSSNAYSDYEARSDEVFRSQNSTKHNRHTLSISSRLTTERPSTVIDTCSASIPFTQFSNGDVTRGNKMRKSLRNLLKATKLSKHSNGQ